MKGSIFRLNDPGSLFLAKRMKKNAVSLPKASRSNGCMRDVFATKRRWKLEGRFVESRLARCSPRNGTKEERGRKLPASHGKGKASHAMLLFVFERSCKPRKNLPTENV